MCSVGSSSQSLRGGLLAVAWPAQAFKVRIVIGAAMRLGLNVVYGSSSYGAPIAQTFLAQVIVTLQDTLTPGCPVAAVSSLVSALALLVILPASVLMFFAVARSVGCRLAASVLAACTRYSCWHKLPPEHSPMDFATCYANQNYTSLNRCRHCPNCRCCNHYCNQHQRIPGLVG